MKELLRGAAVAALGAIAVFVITMVGIREMRMMVRDEVERTVRETAHHMRPSFLCESCATVLLEAGAVPRDAIVPSEPIGPPLPEDDAETLGDAAPAAVEEALGDDLEEAVSEGHNVPPE